MKTVSAWLILIALPAAAADAPALFDAIRAGDTAYLKAHLTKPELEARDRRGATPLMHAAAFGNLNALKLLIDAGADVKARNDMDATALLWAAADPEKARLLIEHGADVTVASKQGRTPLMVAAARKGGAAIVDLLLSKGADVHAKDRVGETALTIAARSGDLDIVKLLLAKGAEPNTADAVGRRPLFAAAIGQNPAIVRLLLQHGAAVNAATSRPPGAAVRTTNNIKNGPPNSSNITALHNAAAFGPAESVRELLNAGANVNAQDSRKLAPLSFALATEYPSLDIVRTLIRAEADVNLADNNGDTPLDWAEKFGYPEIIAELKKAGATRGRTHQAPQPPADQPVQPGVALQRTLKLLEATSATFFNGSGCVSCHNQNVIVRAQAAAKAAGLSTNEALEKEQTLQMKSEWVSQQEAFLQGMLPGGGAPRLAENLLGLQAAKYAPDGITDSAVVAMVAAQRPDGSWRSNEIQHRPPISQSPFSATAKIIRVLQHYAIPARKQEFAQTIEHARIWLTKANPATSEDYAMRLYGLYYADAPQKDVKQAADALLALQHPDGGWGPNPYMKSDAYATGVALTSLAESKTLTAHDGAFQRGINYLLSTQFPDGSWYVRSRSIKFQPYFESGFPFGHDQWISTAATAWAAQAIAFSLEPDGKRPSSAQNRH
jgi:ankyrin repeat protein